MAKDYDLVFQDSNTGALENAGNVINRRQFLRYGFNTATGVLAASLGVLGFASILLPPGEGLQVTFLSNFGQRVEKIQHGMVQSTYRS